MDARQRTAAVIVAAGRGTRAGGGLPKQWRDLGGESVLARSVAALAPHVGRTIVVLHEEDMDRGLAAFGGRVTLVAGGATRSDSVRAALDALDDGDVDRVLIHDGARPLVAPATVERVLAALDRHDGAAAGLAVTDALWRTDGPGDDRTVWAIVPREGLWRAQTPQGFRLKAILAAYRAFGGAAADDVAVALAAGLDVVAVPGDEDNIKITWPDDFARAERTLGARMDLRSGNGFDVHAFGPGDHVWLCGVKVPHDRGLVGHSDADVGMHALTDALYGALAEGDIGRHFPPSDPQWKGAASRIFLAHAAERVRARGFRLASADVTLICERPKIGPHAVEMARVLAEILGADPARVSVKATTSERLGFTGREEGIAALATVALLSP